MKEAPRNSKNKAWISAFVAFTLSVILAVAWSACLGDIDGGGTCGGYSTPTLDSNIILKGYSASTFKNKEKAGFVKAMEVWSE